jgi:hypothetical protein
MNKLQRRLLPKNLAAMILQIACVTSRYNVNHLMPEFILNQGNPCIMDPNSLAFSIVYVLVLVPIFIWSIAYMLWTLWTKNLRDISSGRIQMRGVKYDRSKQPIRFRLSLILVFILIIIMLFCLFALVGSLLRESNLLLKDLNLF